MAQLSRARDRSMHSIVATIQAEQDQAIRAPGKGVVSISGGPGTGKTVVALHRAAYLLYTDRRRYEGGGVLIVGPSGVFMRYIERVLPVARRDRGRAAVAGRGRRRRPRDPARRAGGRRREGLGADGRADAAYRAAAGARQPDRVPDLLARRRDHARPRAARPAPPPADVAGSAQPPAARGSPRTLLDAMWRQVKGERGRDRGREAFNDEMLSNQEFVDFAVSWWPPLDAPEVLSWLRDPDFLARIAEGVRQRRGPAAAREVVERRRLAVGRGRAAARRAALRARRRARAHTRTTTSSTTTSARTCRS